MGNHNRAGIMMPFIVRSVRHDGSQRVTPLIVPSQQKKPKPSVEERGRKAWTVLHEQRLGTAEWLQRSWFPLIPQGCGCGSSTGSFIKQCPPRYNSEEDWFAWTVELHNMVNRKLNKPEITLEEAMQIWRPTAQTMEVRDGLDDPKD